MGQAIARRLGPGNRLLLGRQELSRDDAGADGLSGEASFITGTDLGVDGGVVGTFRTGTVVVS
jgi:hypothetical protein